MIDFYSASTRAVNAGRAIEECFAAAFGQGQETDCDLVILHAAMGHPFGDLVKRTRELAPSARIVGASCCGVIGREGVGESMRDVAMMAMRGKGELFLAGIDGIYGTNSYEKARELALDLQSKSDQINMLYYISSGIDISNDHAIAGIESVFGQEMTIFGGTASDDMRGLTSHQFYKDQEMEYGAFLIGFADPTLRVVTRATHGFVATGEPFVVTRSNGSCIYELDGKPAWEEYTRRLGLSVDSTCEDTIPIGALAEELPEDLAREYGNPHILRAVTRRGKIGKMHYTSACPEGTKLWLTQRDEPLIFSEMEKTMASLCDEAQGASPVAVFHSDCLARGRYLLHQIHKEELIAMMQTPLSTEGVIPPWLGMYGFGEFARLGGRNRYHNYSTGLYVLFRD